MNSRPLGWVGIFRLGLVQTALGAIVVLTTSTMNRVMVVEFSLPAVVPGALVAIHYVLQMFRPRLGHGSDVGGRRTPWIVGGMAILGVGGTSAALATAWMAASPVAGVVAAAGAFALIGLGVGAAGTSLLVLLAKRVAPPRRAAAATIVWVMMIAGFAITATVAGSFLDPFTPARLVMVTAVVAAAAFLLTVAAVRGLEGPSLPDTPSRDTRPDFRETLLQVWSDRRARGFTIFVFVSMLAYSLQDLILEPFAGTVFGLTPGQSTRLAGMQHGGVLLGMVGVAIACSGPRALRMGSLRAWIIAGCAGSALALMGLAIAGMAGPPWPLRANVFLLGLCNGAFAVAAIGSMMTLAGANGDSREGIRMGLWGAAQAIAFGAGGFIGTLASDIARLALGSPAAAYAAVFALEAILFVVSVRLASNVAPAGDRAPRETPSRHGGRFLAGIHRG